MGSRVTSKGVRGDSSELGEHLAGAGGKTSNGGRCVRRLGKGEGISHKDPRDQASESMMAE